MFVLPANDRDSVLTSALQGLSKSGRVLSEHAAARQAKEAMKRLSAGELDIGAILKSGLDPKTEAALIQHLTEVGYGGGRGRSSQGGGGMPQQNQMSDDELRARGRLPQQQQQNQMSTEELQARGRLPQQQQYRGMEGQVPGRSQATPTPQAKKHDFIDLDPQYLEELAYTKGKRGVASLEKQVDIHNKRVEHFIKANEPMVNSVYEHANSGRQLVENADMLEELVKSGDLQSPLTAWFQEKTGIPISTFGNVNDEIFGKVVNGLLSPYLKQNYANLGGRILKTEVDTQRQAIITAKNSDEAKRLLINLIRELGQTGLDVEQDYQDVIDTHGIGDPQLRQHLNEAAHERWENAPIPFTTNDGRELMIRRKDRSKVMQLDAQLAQELKLHPNGISIST